MDAVKVVQVGLGPLGRKMVQFMLERKGVSIVAAVDKDPALAGRSLGELCEVDCPVRVSSSLTEALDGKKADVAILSTLSDMVRITAQIEEIVGLGLPVVSTCEELSFPWEKSPALAARIDQSAKRSGVAVLGTGVNPGFMMDAFPIAVTAICQRVDSIKISRLQDAQFRRIPFQKKIGAGLSLVEFDKKKADGTLRHVGLVESMQMIASRMGWKLDKVEESLSPIVADRTIATPGLTIQEGKASGVQQIGRGWSGGKEVITLVFRAAVGEPGSEDSIEITGNPNVVSTIKGGVNGDIATCAITINAIRQVLHAPAGLRTMADIPMVSWFG